MHSIEINLFNSDKFIAHVNKNHIIAESGLSKSIKRLQKLNQDAGQKLFLMH